MAKRHDLGGIWLFQAAILTVGGAVSLLRAFGFI